MEEAIESKEKRFRRSFWSVAFFFEDKGERLKKMKKEKERMKIQNNGLEIERLELGAPPSCFLDMDTTFYPSISYLSIPFRKSIFGKHLSYFVAFCRILSLLSAELMGG